LITSLGVTFVVALLFCFLRPFNTVVYAPRLKHADEKHAPPVIGKGPFAWVKPVFSTKEDVLAEKIGLDATVFLRFTKMCRNIFAVLSIIGCAVIIPINVVGGAASHIDRTNVSTFLKLTPQFLFGQYYWGFILCAYLFDIVVCGFLWWNYKAVARLRRNYFESPDYQNSLHARTLMASSATGQVSPSNH
jgi:calcium permeable stress-gated cation channel